MKYIPAAALIVASAGLGQAQNAHDAYLASICSPKNASGSPILEVPCNAVAAIQAQCMYGAASLEDFFADMFGSGRKRAAEESAESRGAGDGSSEENGRALQSNETQRVCICESGFWDQMAGCVACYSKHGSLGIEGFIPESVLQGASSTYCAVSATASLGLADFLYSVAIGVTPTATASPTGTGSTSIKYADPIGNKTDISYYYTQAATGTAAWSIPQPTGTSGAASYTTTNIQDGQIRPTASSNNGAANSGGSQSGNGNNTTSGNAAGRYEAVGAVGLFGLTGLLALL